MPAADADVKDPTDCGSGPRTVRPSLFIHHAASNIDIHPEIHVPAPAAPPAPEVPDNVHPLQKR